MTDTSVKNIVNDCTQILDDDAFVLLALQSQMRSKVATLLQNNGVSLDEISLKTGIDLQNLQKMKNGDAGVSLQNLRQLLDALDFFIPDK